MFEKERVFGPENWSIELVSVSYNQKMFHLAAET